MALKRRVDSEVFACSRASTFLLSLFLLLALRFLDRGEGLGLVDLTLDALKDPRSGGARGVVVDGR